MGLPDHLVAHFCFRGLKKFARWVLPRSSPKQPELAAESGTGPGLVVRMS